MLDFKNSKVMKKTNKYLFAILSTVTLGISFSSCTKLDETVYSKIKDDNFYKNKRGGCKLRSALLHMQAWLAPTGGNGFYYHSELSADQVAGRKRDAMDMTVETISGSTIIPGQAESRMRGAWS
jgi:hypothetical protein